MVSSLVWIKNKINLKYLYFFSVLCYFLSEFHFKFFWNIPSYIFIMFNIFCFLICYHKYLINKIKLMKNFQFASIKKYQNEIFNFRLISLLTLFYLFIISQIISNRGLGFIGLSATAIVGTFLIILPINDKYNLFQFLIKCYAIILLISLIGWILVCICGIDFPMKISTFGDYKFYDYYFFNIRVEGTSLSRYLGMFLEPGHTGIMTVLLLISNGFDLRKKENVVLLIASLFTLSFATYILIFSYLTLKIFLFKKNRSLFIRLLPFGVIIFLLLYQLDSFRGIVDYYLFNRIEYIINGNITGNRFSDKFDIFYNSTIKGELKNYLLGIGSAKYLEIATMNFFKSAGYKVYIAQNGLIGLFIVIIYYMKSLIKKFDFNYLILFIIWFLSFLDISYPIWGSFIIFSILAPYNLEKVLEVNRG